MSLYRPADLSRYVFSPIKRGRVTFAGRNRTHKDYGLFVSIWASNGKYMSLSGHLDGLRRGLDRGARVTRKTVIGYAGNSGGPDFPVGPVHLHQAFYRKPKLNPDGSPYGGRGCRSSATTTCATTGSSTGLAGSATRGSRPRGR